MSLTDVGDASGDGFDPIATAAFVVAALAFLTQSWLWWRGRRRIGMHPSIITFAEALPDGGVNNTFYVTVTVWVVNGAVGLRDVTFLDADKKSFRHSVTVPDRPSSNHGESMALGDRLRATDDPSGVKRVLRDGEMFTQVFLVTPAEPYVPRAGGPMGPRIRAKLTTVDGKTLISKPFVMPVPIVTSQGDDEEGAAGVGSEATP